MPPDNSGHERKIEMKKLIAVIVAVLLLSGLCGAISVSAEESDILTVEVADGELTIEVNGDFGDTDWIGIYPAAQDTYQISTVWWYVGNDGGTWVFPDDAAVASRNREGVFNGFELVPGEYFAIVLANDGYEPFDGMEPVYFEIGDEPEPTANPTAEPTANPTAEPVDEPTAGPNDEPTAEPTSEPTVEPTAAPTDVPTEAPTQAPTAAPTQAPTDAPVDNTATDAPADNNADDKSGDPKTGLIIGLICGAVVIAAVIVAEVLAKKKAGKNK
ncbi:MAG: PT domain-containing protein [Clostridia bacterium]|nr:PT domain-containing protein [Clostridia bacterium]